MTSASRYEADIYLTPQDRSTRDALAKRSLTQFKGFTADMEKDILREISEGVANGESTEELSRRIDDVNVGSKVRANRIARTEVNNAALEGARARYKNAGVEYVQVITGNNPCDVCLPREGKIYLLTDTKNLPLYHPNCGCAIVPVRAPNVITKSSLDELKRLVDEQNAEALPPEAVDGVDFLRRTNLTKLEKSALLHHQDIGNRQYKWNVAAPDSTHRDNSIVQKALRDKKFYDSLSKRDQEQVDKIVYVLNSAINKGRVKEDIEVIKGVSEDIFKNADTMHFITDEGFGSYALYPKNAVKYTKTQPDGRQIYIRLLIPKGTHSVYLEKESEYLLKNGMQYSLSSIEEDGVIEGHRAKIYNMEVINV